MLTARLKLARVSFAITNDARNRLFVDVPAFLSKLAAHQKEKPSGVPRAFQRGSQLPQSHIQENRYGLYA